MIINAINNNNNNNNNTVQRTTTVLVRANNNNNPNDNKTLEQQQQQQRTNDDDHQGNNAKGKPKPLSSFSSFSSSSSLPMIKNMIIVVLTLIVLWQSFFVREPPGQQLFSSDNASSSSVVVVVGQQGQETTKNTNKCPQEGSFTPPSDKIVIDYAKIRQMDPTPLHAIQEFTAPHYVPFLLEKAGKEHYPFLQYMASEYGDCRHITDIGTRHVTSALTLAAASSSRQHYSPIWTFDLPTSRERHQAFQGKTENDWQQHVQDRGLKILFFNVDLLTCPIEQFQKYMSTWFVMLDTHHLPYSVPFEREFFQRLLEINFKGIFGLDDISLNAEMKQWWQELKDNASKYHRYRVFDITPVGHFSGTGLIDFSGTVVIQE